MVDSAVIFGCFRHIWWKFNGGFWRTGVMGLIQDFLKMEKITRLPPCHTRKEIKTSRKILSILICIVLYSRQTKTSQNRLKVNHSRKLIFPNQLNQFETSLKTYKPLSCDSITPHFCQGSFRRNEGFSFSG